VIQTTTVPHRILLEFVFCGNCQYGPMKLTPKALIKFIFCAISPCHVFSPCCITVCFPRVLLLYVFLCCVTVCFSLHCIAIFVSRAMLLYVISVLCGRLKVCIVTLLSAASFVIVSAGGSYVVWLSIFGQLIISMSTFVVFTLCL